jgi:hypothetical protein
MATYLKPGDSFKPSGSVEHFYHFVLQYLLPLFELEMTKGVAGKGSIVRDCGPMNVWFDFVFGPDAFSIVSRESFNNLSSRRLWDKQIELDTFANKNGLTVDATRFKEVLAAFREKSVPPVLSADTVTVLDRRPPPAFYLDGSAEKPGGGSTRRSISNLDQLSHKISETMNVSLVDFGEMSPASQLKVISNTRVLVGQHGAGLVHSLFMNDDASVVEMKLEKSQDHFQILNEGLGRTYRAFYLSEEHATLSPRLIAEIVDEVSAGS